MDQESNDQPIPANPETPNERQGLLDVLRNHSDYLRVSGLRNTGDRMILGSAAGALLVGETIGGEIPTLLGALGGAVIAATIRHN